MKKFPSLGNLRVGWDVSREVLVWIESSESNPHCKFYGKVRKSLNPFESIICAST
jgi:hypothetical protein